MTKKRNIRFILDLLLMALLVALDQYTKYLAVIRLKNQKPYDVIEGVFQFYYLENRGAAFGILQNQKVFFLVIGFVLLVLIAYALYKTPHEKKYYIFRMLLVLIAAGAIGNMADRVRFDYVIDFLYFKLINFPIFNIADCYVTAATLLFCLLFLFYYKEEDLKFLNPRDTRPKYRKLGDD